MLPGGNPGEYFINGPILGLSGYLLRRLNVDEQMLLQVVADAKDDDGVARWLREHTDPSKYEKINVSLTHIGPEHAEDPEVFKTIYADTLRENPHLVRIVDVIEADDARMFREHSHVDAPGGTPIGRQPRGPSTSSG